MEIEAKIKVNKAEMKRLEDKFNDLLAEYGLQRLDHTTERNLIYTSPWMTEGSFLRIRYETHRVYGGRSPYDENQIIITYKGKNLGKGLNCREEVEADVTICGDGSAFGNLLEALGFKIYSSYAKERNSIYRKDTVISLDYVTSTIHKFERISFDELDKRFCKSFVEVEAKTEEQVLSTLKELGLQNKPIIQKSYADMFAKK